jgi:hypothetical protein
MRNELRDNQAPTDIFRFRESAEDRVGYLDGSLVVYRLHFDDGIAIGRVDLDGRVFRMGSVVDREVGVAAKDGMVHSHGLLEGGPLGWVDANGIVTQAGLLFGETEIGRVAGPQTAAAAAALLLLFLPDEQEANRDAERA